MFRSSHPTWFDFYWIFITIITNVYNTLLPILSCNFLLLKIICVLLQQVEDKEGSNSPSVTMPFYLLEQIRYQREKLESSLCHNDFIRRQLEGLMSSLSSQGGDNMTSLWQKMRETAEQLEEARHRNQELETELQEMRAHFEESAEKARLVNDVTEKLQVGCHGLLCLSRPPLWSSGQEFLTTDAGVPGSIPGALQNKSSVSGTGSIQPREYN
jgi:hypothetical protein